MSILRRRRGGRQRGARGGPELNQTIVHARDPRASATFISEMLERPGPVRFGAVLGQIVLPAASRRRLGMGAGARIEVLEESYGLKLRVVRPVSTADITGMAGMVKAPSRGVARRLEDFDPASLLTRSRRSKR